ncbi:MAG: hypothetical protein ABIJ48_04090 [Actinomycetota bacterium]
MAGLALAVAFFAAACSTPTGGGRFTTTAPGSTTIDTVTTTTGVLEPCTVRESDLPPQDLPAEVAALRERIYRAAITCDFDTLATLVAERWAPVLGYGGPSMCNGDPVDHWDWLINGFGGDPLHLIAGTLELSYTMVQVDYGDVRTGTFYLWPAVVGKDSPTEADWQELQGLYTTRLIRDVFRASKSGRDHIFSVCLPAEPD